MSEADVVVTVAEPWSEGRQSTQRWALAVRDYEEAKERMEEATARMVEESANTASYVRSDGPVACKINNSDDIVMVWWDLADGAIHAKVAKA